MEGGTTSAGGAAGVTGLAAELLGLVAPSDVIVKATPGLGIMSPVEVEAMNSVQLFFSK